VPLPAPTLLPLGSDPAAAVARVPAGPGVGQLLGPGGRSLLLAPTPNLRRWAGAHLGLGKPPAPGRRPRTNLAGVATAVSWVRASGPFAQRLTYERLAASLIPPAERRDLRPPTFLRLDPDQRFPRIVLSTGADSTTGLYGPFRDRRSAERARDAVNRRFALRPCEYVFEPDPALPLGLGCLYAQVRSCAAPCLARVSEGEYRALAARAAAWLAEPAPRADDDEASVPPWVTAAETVRAIVVDPGRKEIGLFPVRAGRVLDEAARTVSAEGLDEAVRRLEWPSGEGASDWPWLAAWIASPRGRSVFRLVPHPDDREALLRDVWSALPARFASPAGGGNVGASLGEA
jgi:hypothetical protein